MQKPAEIRMLSVMYCHAADYIFIIDIMGEIGYHKDSHRVGQNV